MRLILLIAFCALLWSLEGILPLRRYADARVRRRLPNIALAAIVVAMNLALSMFVAALASENAVSLSHAVVGIAALDLATYTAHVLLHKSALAWRFHRVHHSEPEVDVTTAFRQHPGETLWRVAWQLPPVIILGLPMEVVALYLTLSTLNAQLEHANLRVPERADRVLRWLFVTPNMHKVHHSRVQRETDSNYANIFSIWDRLFGTYTRRADLETLRYGLDGFDHPSRQTLRGLLGLPFALMLAFPIFAAPKKTVAFMCPYGGAKSVIAMSYFNQLAEREELPYTAVAVSAEKPYDAVPENVAAFLANEGFTVTSFKPREVQAADLESAAKVISIDCDLTKLDAHGATIERWDDVPKVSVDLPASAAAIRKHVEKLVAQLK